MAGSSALAMEAVRALYEGVPASLDLLARASGRTQVYLERRARREGWRAPAAAEMDAQTLERRLVALSDRLVCDLEAASAEGHVAGGYDKSRIDALSAMLKMVEKLGEMTRVPERAAQEQKKNDAELAAALALIDARIVELACELAASMGTASAAPAGAGAAPDR